MQTGNEDSREEAIPDFPAGCLPPVLEAIAQEIAEVCRVPLGMAAPMVLATASASLGRGLHVDSLPGLTTSPNLFVLVCKTSGSGGSVTYRHATAPLMGMQKALRREFEENTKPRLDAEHADVSQQLDALKRRLKEAKGTDRAETVTEIAACNADLHDIEARSAGKLLLLSDVTSEGLASFLMKHGETLAHFDADAADALGTIMGRYGDREHTNDSLWLKGYTGEPHVVFRKNSEPVHLDAPCLAVLFVATPDKVQELFRNGRLTRGGLLARFLVCDPGARPMPLNEETEEAARSLSSDSTQPYEAAIFDAVNRYRFHDGEPPLIRMKRDARRLIVNDWNRFCAVASDGEDSPFEARHTENAIRLALVLHAFQHVRIEKRAPATYGAELFGHDADLAPEQAQAALTIRDWFTLHQKALREPQKVAADDKAWEKTQALIRDRPAEKGVTPRDLYTGNRVCRTALEAERLLAQWGKEGRVVAFERRSQGAGRPTTAYRLMMRNPRGG